MAIFVIDPQKVTVTAHRPDCPEIPTEGCLDCKCSAGEIMDKQLWLCETHFDETIVKEQMEGRYWILLLCDTCFKPGATLR